MKILSISSCAAPLSMALTCSHSLALISHFFLLKNLTSWPQLSRFLATLEAAGSKLCKEISSGWYLDMISANT